MPTKPLPRLLTVAQAAEKYAPAITVRSLRAMIADNTIGVHKVHGRVFVPEPEVERVIHEGYRAPRMR